MNWGAIILAAGGLIGGATGVVSLLTIRGQRRKLLSESKNIDADAATKLSEAAVELLEPARKQVKDMQAQLDRASKRIGDLEQALEGAQSEVTTLKGQLADMTKDLRTAHDEIRRLSGD